jgi:3-oxoadipate enol-lactonase
MRMKVEANGIQINYELSGQEGAPAVVLSHSLGSSLEMWNPQIVSLEPHYRVLRYDTRGHGGSEAPAQHYSLDQLGEDAVSLLDVLGIDWIHFVGLSMGGMIGQYLALNHGNRLKSLVLCDTAALIPPEAQPVWQERIDTAREKGLTALVESTLQRWFTPPYLDQNPPQVQLIRKLFLSTPTAGYIGCSEAIRSLDYLEQLAEIKIPTLIIVGRDDPGTPVAAAQAMHKRITDSKLVVLDSAAHLSNVEQSEAFNQSLMKFINTH